MNLGFPEMVFLFLLALLIFGPKKLPEIGRQIGRALAEFRRASNEFKSQLESEMRQIELDELKKQEPSPSIQPPEGAIASSTRPAATGSPEPETALPAKAADA